jgi:Cys-tRNA(Pro)/Cys-tRNA(Cys) deacylase
MLPLKDLTSKTGYIRGGCSAIGMKKSYPTIIDNSALQLKQIIASAGKPGLQMKLDPQELARCTDATFHDVVKDS